MTLKDKLMDDLKQSMKNKEQIRKSVVILIRSAIKQKEVDERVEVSEEDVLVIIQKQLKQRKDALEEFKKAQREDLILQTEQEIDILTQYLPKQLTDDELESIIRDIINQIGATTMKDMGKIMGLATPKVQGKADGKRINEVAKKFLN